MTASEFAALLHARRVGRGKWLAKCPAHPDKHPSLSIAEGKHQPLVFRCMSNGCTNDEVLGSLGLKWKDVLGERSVDPEILRQIRAAEARERAIREVRINLLWMARRKVEWWHRKSEVLGRSLMRWPEQDKLARDFHRALDMERRAQRIFEVL
jgi:hypothetical protein